MPSTFSYKSETGNLIKHNGKVSKLICMVINCGHSGAMGLLANGEMVEYDLHDNKEREDFNNKFVKRYIASKRVILN